MLQYKAGYKFVNGGVHTQVLDFPAAITCGADMAEAQHLLTIALIDVAETLLEIGQVLPQPNPLVSNSEMDVEEPIYLHLIASTAVNEVPAGRWHRETKFNSALGLSPLSPTETG